MSFEPDGYLLTARDGPQLWFVGTRMNVKAGGAQTGGAFTFIEWSARPGSARRCTSMAAKTRRSTSSTARSASNAAPSGSRPGPGTHLLPRGIPHTFLVTRGPVRGLQVTARPGSRSTSRRQAAPRSGPASTRPIPTSRAWPPPGSAMATRSSAHGRAVTVTRCRLTTPRRPYRSSLASAIPDLPGASRLACTGAASPPPQGQGWVRRPGFPRPPGAGNFSPEQRSRLLSGWPRPRMDHRHEPAPQRGGSRLTGSDKPMPHQVHLPGRRCGGAVQLTRRICSFRVSRVRW